MMKTITLSVFTLLGLVLTTIAQTADNPGKRKPPLPQARDWTVTERGASHRVWEATVVQRDPQTGRDRYERHKVVELAGGLHRQNEQGEWVETSDVIELFVA